MNFCERGCTTQCYFWSRWSVGWHQHICKDSERPHRCILNNGRIYVFEFIEDERGAVMSSRHVPHDEPLHIMKDQSVSFIMRLLQCLMTDVMDSGAFQHFLAFARHAFSSSIPCATSYSACMMYQFVRTEQNSPSAFFACEIVMKNLSCPTVSSKQRSQHHVCRKSSFDQEIAAFVCWYPSKMPRSSRTLMDYKTMDNEWREIFGKPFVILS